MPSRWFAGLTTSDVNSPPARPELVEGLRNHWMCCAASIEVTDETLDLESIRDVCLTGPGHYLGHEQTLSRMQTDYLYPEVGDRESVNNWLDQGSTDITERARERTRTILASHYPGQSSPEIDEQIRREFPVRLARERMGLLVGAGLEPAPTEEGLPFPPNF